MKNSYKKIIKNEKGITLLALVVIIVVLIILSSIVVNIGKEGIKESKEDAMISELSIVQNAILQRKTKIDVMGRAEESTEQVYPGQKITELGIDLENTIEEINNEIASGEEEITRKDNDDDNYYLLSTENGGLEALGITNSEDEYIVNYETGEVINYTTKLTGTGKPLYIYAKEQ